MKFSLHCFNLHLVTIERSCAHAEEQPKNLVHEKSYLETKEDLNGLVIEEIETIFCALGKFI